MLFFLDCDYLFVNLKKGDIMKELIIDATYKTPYVEMNRSGQLIIRGRSIPENAVAFYQPINQWIIEYGQRPSESTLLEVNLEYLNTSSTKCFMDVLKNLERIKKQGNKVSVVWHYKEDDVDMLEIGQDYGNMLNLEFIFMVD